MTFSPSGNAIVFLGTRDGQRQLYFRELNAQEARPIAGTEGAFCTPFFSPDGQWIGFLADGKLKKASVNGGAVVVLADMPGISGASWEIEEAIILSPGPGTRGLQRVPTAGGAPEQVTTLDTASGEKSHLWPQVLPGGNIVLFAASSSENVDENRIVAQDLRTGEQRTLVQGGTFPHYVPTGHVVYVQKGILMAVEFDPETMEVRGSPRQVRENVMESGQGAAQYGVSHLGSFVYVPEGAEPDQRQLVWVDRTGKEQSLDAPMNAFTLVRLSPDSSRAIVEVQGAVRTTWIYDVPRQTRTRFFYEGEGTWPLWTPDSKQIVFFSRRAGTGGLFRKPAGGGGAEEQLMVTQGTFTVPVSFSPDGRFLAFAESRPATGYDIGILPLEGARTPQPFLQTRFNETTPMVSPDGRWLAYTSNESGRSEIYVQPFPTPGEKVQISRNGGADPVWAPSGRELFFRGGDRMLAVPVQTGARFVAGNPVELFDERAYAKLLAGAVSMGSYDVTADGRRFLMIKALRPCPDADQRRRELVRGTEAPRTDELTSSDDDSRSPR